MPESYVSTENPSMLSVSSSSAKLATSISGSAIQHQVGIEVSTVEDDNPADTTITEDTVAAGECRWLSNGTKAVFCVLKVDQRIFDGTSGNLQHAAMHSAGFLIQTSQIAGATLSV